MRLTNLYHYYFDGNDDVDDDGFAASLSIYLCLLFEQKKTTLIKTANHVNCVQFV